MDTLQSETTLDYGVVQQQVQNDDMLCPRNKSVPPHLYVYPSVSNICSSTHAICYTVPYIDTSAKNISYRSN